VENTDVRVDSRYYPVDEKGNVKIQLRRGLHELIVQSPGFEKYSSTLDVKGRIYLIEHYLGKNP
jgi:hypothetical protein